MIRISFDIKCKKGQATIKPKIYCKGKATQCEDNVDELITALYASGLADNITKASAALREGVTNQVKFLSDYQLSNFLRNFVKDHGFDFEDIYKDSGDPFVSK